MTFLATERALNMFSDVSAYVFSESFFLDALLIVFIYLCVFYSLPRMFKAIFRREIDSAFGIHRISAEPIKYILMLLGNFFLFSLFAFGAFVILYEKHGFFR
jgi:hypothetical protein